MRLLRLLPIAALDRPQDVALRQRLQVIGDLPYSLVHCFRQIGCGCPLDRSLEVGEEDPPSERMADSADQL
jgi:hypothetical protein